MRTHYTPAPWRLGEYDEELGAYRIYGGFTGMGIPAVALGAGPNKDSALSNALLIAKAPVLLEICRNLIRAMPLVDGENGHIQRTAISQALEVISEVTGGAA